MVKLGETLRFLYLGVSPVPHHLGKGRPHAVVEQLLTLYRTTKNTSGEVQKWDVKRVSHNSSISRSTTGPIFSNKLEMSHFHIAPFDTCAPGCWHLNLFPSCH